MEITEEQRQRAEANRLAALAKRKAALEPESPATTTKPQDPWKLFKCRKPSSELTTTTTTTHFTKQQSPETISVDPFLKPHLPEMFRARLEICSPDSFSVTPVAVQGFVYPGETACLRRLSDCLSNVVPSHYTQNHSGGKACVYKLRDYDAVLKCLKNSKSIELEGIPWGTLNVVERLSHSFVAGRWIPCRPEHLSHEKVDELIKNLPKKLLDALLPFQVDGLRFGLQRGGRCLIADEMGLGKTLQAIAIASCFRNEGSILIVCPAILRFSWAEELERWLPFCLPVDIHLVFGHHDNPDYLMKFPRIVVISYTMLHHLRKSMLEREWAFLIVDESHHVRCTKKTSESEEIKAVLDVATKVKHIVLLSGTPSLSRPYDIFHQINMLWPGLLGKDKFEFAKTYCAVKSVWGSQGKIFQDFSKGIRLEELNVLLKQTVMIRRLKEHVLVQLPPKRRQIIRLLLKRSDIVSAKAAADVGNSDAPEKKIIEDSPLEFFDEPDGSVGCLGSSIKLTYQELGIAKLTGFREWLSLHPIVAELDGAANLDRNPSSQKMIIFAHHHKVLDGVQEFVCERGIGFVRIDGNSLPRDRQLAVLSFQSSAEVKIAIVGIEAGGVGLDFSAAQNVVFLELPKTASWLRQAEDRAHRRGQTSAVNIYIFCAKDTLDESHWQNMNKSLHLVSSTTDGKYDAVQEIAVEGVSCLEMSSKTDRSVENRILEYAVCGELTAEPVKLPYASLAQDMHPVEVYNEVAEKVIDKFEEQSETCGNLTQTDDLNIKADVVSDLPVEKACVSMGELEGSAFEVKIGSRGRVSSFRLDEGSKEKGQEINPGTTKIDDGRPVQQIEADESCSDRVDFLRFEVSQYTGRIHLYSCIPGTDSRPRPLFENFRPEEIESLNAPDADNNRKTAFKFVRENPAFRHAILAFIDQWKNLRPIERRKLLRKPLQLPLTVELCYLNENINHNSEGLLRGGSNRRNTPLYEINHSLPSQAVWKKVHLCGGYGKKEKEYTQGWTLTDEPLCKLCQTPCRTDNAKTPEFFEDLFCNFGCYEEYRIRISNRFLRQELFQLEHGVCTNCHLDCHKLVKHLKPLSLPRRQDYIEKVAPKVARRKKLLDKLVNDPTEGNAWHADHIVPVYRGGGECRLENMRTLCVTCHLDVTAAQCAERRSARVKAKKQLKVIMSNLKNGQNMEGNDANLMDQGHLEIQENLVEDELLIKVPGSAYSGGKSSSTGSEDLEKSTKAH